MTHSSLDPRFQRLELNYDESKPHQSANQDQFITFEAFQLVKANKPFEHVGIVHAPDRDIAFLFAKEQYSRRGNECLAMAIVSSSDITLSHTTEGKVNVMDSLPDATISAGDTEESWAVFGLKKRGKHHIMLGEVTALSPSDAFLKAKELYYTTPMVNLWTCKKSALLFTDQEDQDMWNTLNDKKYRDAIAYKSADKINAYLASQKNQ
jgi:ring-1,2-phenylacetyl-CoA epoxidase subunit PaaB